MSLVGPGADIVVPPHVTQPDYEGEVAVVIGRRLPLNVAERRRPRRCSAGVNRGPTTSAPVTTSTRGEPAGSWSKSFDTFCPLGPELVTLDEVDWCFRPRGWRRRVNGEVRPAGAPPPTSSSRSPRLSFAHLSQGCTLQGGRRDPHGNARGEWATARTPPTYKSKDGDEVVITVAGVGTLRNRVRRPVA